DVARAANLEIAHGDAKARAQITELFNRLQPPRCGIGQRSAAARTARQKIAVGPELVAADAAAELVQIGHAEALGPIDEERVGVGNVETGLDDRGADEYVGLAADEPHHYFFELLAGHLPVTDDESGLRHQRGEMRRN